METQWQQGQRVSVSVDCVRGVELGTSDCSAFEAGAAGTRLTAAAAAAVCLTRALAEEPAEQECASASATRCYESAVRADHSWLWLSGVRIGSLALSR